MTATDGIDTHISQYEKFAAERILIEGSTQTSEVVMLTYAIEFHILAIEEESLLGIKLHITESSGRHLSIHHLALHQEFALHLIYIWRNHIPKFRILHLQGLLIRSTGLGSHHPPLGIIDGIAEGRFQGDASSIRPVDSHFHCSIRSGRYILSPLGDMGSL